VEQGDEQRSLRDGLIYSDGRLAHSSLSVGLSWATLARSCFCAPTRVDLRRFPASVITTAGPSTLQIIASYSAPVGTELRESPTGNTNSAHIELFGKGTT
jgi:hypothetical protein